MVEKRYKNILIVLFWIIPLLGITFITASVQAQETEQITVTMDTLNQYGEHINGKVGTYYATEQSSYTFTIANGGSIWAAASAYGRGGVNGIRTGIVIWKDTTYTVDITGTAPVLTSEVTPGVTAVNCVFELIDVTMDTKDQYGEHIAGKVGTYYATEQSSYTFTIASGGDIWAAASAYGRGGVNGIRTGIVIWKDITYTVDITGTAPVLTSEATPGVTAVNCVFELIDVTIDTKDQYDRHIDGKVGTWYATEQSPYTFTMANGGEVRAAAIAAGKGGVNGISIGVNVWKDTTYSIDATEDLLTLTSESTFGVSDINFVFKLEEVFIANAGQDIVTSSEDQKLVIIEGSALESNNNSFEYRWLEGENELSTWKAVGLNGEAFLDLSSISTFSVGQHTLTLEITDGQVTSSDNMNLTIENSAPHAAPTGGGVYEIHSTIALGGEVSDFDGDVLTCEWLEGNVVLFTDVISTVAGGGPVVLPERTLSYAVLGTHTITLKISDNTNAPVTKDITIEVIDATAPTLAPVPNQSILWPPNHKMVGITIEANGSDNLGGVVTLSATVTCNEPDSGLWDGDLGTDWTEPAIDQNSGIITLQLRAERDDSSNGRVYTITITASDESHNASQCNVEIIVPHDKGKK